MVPGLNFLISSISRRFGMKGVLLCAILYTACTLCMHNILAPLFRSVVPPTMPAPQVQLVVDKLVKQYSDYREAAEMSESTNGKLTPIIQAVQSLEQSWRPTCRSSRPADKVVVQVLVMEEEERSKIKSAYSTKQPEKSYESDCEQLVSAIEFELEKVRLHYYDITVEHLQSPKAHSLFAILEYFGLDGFASGGRQVYNRLMEALKKTTEVFLKMKTLTLKWESQKLANEGRATAVHSEACLEERVEPANAPFVVHKLTTKDLDFVFSSLLHNIEEDDSGDCEDDFEIESNCKLLISMKTTTKKCRPVNRNKSFKRIECVEEGNHVDQFASIFKFTSIPHITDHIVPFVNSRSFSNVDSGVKFALSHLANHLHVFTHDLLAFNSISWTRIYTIAPDHLTPLPCPFKESLLNQCYWKEMVIGRQIHHGMAPAIGSMHGRVTIGLLVASVHYAIRGLLLRFASLSAFRYPRFDSTKNVYSVMERNMAELHTIRWLNGDDSPVFKTMLNAYVHHYNMMRVFGAVNKATKEGVETFIRGLIARAKSYMMVPLASLFFLLLSFQVYANALPAVIRNVYEDALRNTSNKALYQQACLQYIKVSSLYNIAFQEVLEFVIKCNKGPINDTILTLPALKNLKSAAIQFEKLLKLDYDIVTEQPASLLKERAVFKALCSHADISVNPSLIMKISSLGLPAELVQVLVDIYEVIELVEFLNMMNKYTLYGMQVLCRSAARHVIDLIALAGEKLSLNETFMYLIIGLHAEYAQTLISFSNKINESVLTVNLNRVDVVEYQNKSQGIILYDLDGQLPHTNNKWSLQALLTISKTQSIRYDAELVHLIKDLIAQKSKEKRAKITIAIPQHTTIEGFHRLPQWIRSIHTIYSSIFLKLRSVLPQKLPLLSALHHSTNLEECLTWYARHHYYAIEMNRRDSLPVHYLQELRNAYYNMALSCEEPSIHLRHFASSTFELSNFVMASLQIESKTKQHHVFDKSNEAQTIANILDHFVYTALLDRTDAHSRKKLTAKLVSILIRWLLIDHSSHFNVEERIHITAPMSSLLCFFVLTAISMAWSAGGTVLPPLIAQVYGQAISENQLLKSPQDLALAYRKVCVSYAVASSELHTLQKQGKLVLSDALYANQHVRTLRLVADEFESLVDFEYYIVTESTSYLLKEQVLFEALRRALHDKSDAKIGNALAKRIQEYPNLSSNTSMLLQDVCRVRDLTEHLQTMPGKVMYALQYTCRAAARHANDLLALAGEKLCNEREHEMQLILELHEEQSKFLMRHVNHINEAVMMVDLEKYDTVSLCSKKHIISLHDDNIIRPHTRRQWSIVDLERITLLQHGALTGSLINGSNNTKARTIMIPPHFRVQGYHRLPQWTRYVHVLFESLFAKLKTKVSCREHLLSFVHQMTNLEECLLHYCRLYRVAMANGQNRIVCRRFVEEFYIAFYNLADCGTEPSIHVRHYVSSVLELSNSIIKYLRVNSTTNEHYRFDHLVDDNLLSAFGCFTFSSMIDEKAMHSNKRLLAKLYGI